MKRPIHVIVFALATLLCCSAVVRAQVQVLRSDAQELLLQITPSVSFSRLPSGELLPNYTGLATLINARRAGEPMQWRIPVAVALPSATGNTVEVVSARYDSTLTGILAPVPSNRFSNDKIPTPVYTVNASAYAQSSTVPVAELSGIGIARDVYASTLLVAPYRFDARGRTIRLLRSAIVRIRFATATTPVQRVPISTLTNHSFINSAAAANWNVSTPTVAFAKRSTRSAARAWMRVEVKEEGLYQLTADDFSKAGIDLKSVTNVAIYGGGGDDLPEAVPAADTNTMRQVGTIIERDGSGKIATVLFYGNGPSRWKYPNSLDTIPTHVLSSYVTANSYIVAVDGDASREFTTKQAPTQQPTVYPTWGNARVYLEDEKYNAIGIGGSGGSGRDWFGTQFQPNDTRTFMTSLPGLDRSQPVNYRLRVAHSSVMFGYFSVSQNDTKLGDDMALSAVSGTEATATAASTFVYSTATAIPGDNRSALKFTYKTSGQGQGYLDWYEIHYARSLNADNNQCSFEAPSGNGIAEFRVNGFSSDNILGFDVTDPAFPVRLSPVSTSGAFIFRDFLDIAARRAHRYFIIERSAIKKVANVSKAPFGNLRETNFNADIIVITHPDLSAVATDYVNYRNAQNNSLKAVSVSIDDIYTEFSHGNLDPTAIRDFVAFAVKHWSPRRPQYVVLMGDANYDYRNISTKQKPLIPSYTRQEVSYYYDGINSVPVDDYFACVVGDDERLDLAIGRFPVETVEQGKAVLEKIKLYEGSTNFGSWRQTINLVADDAWSEGDNRGSDDFMTQSEELWRNVLPSWMEANKIYLSLYPIVQTTARRKPAVTAVLQECLQRGAIITNWIGHGNPNVWAHEYILQKDQFIPSLTNDTTLTYVIAATCNFGYFDDPATVSGAEMFVLNPNGGAVSVMSSSRGSYIAQNRTLMLAYYRELFRRDSVTHLLPTIGAALYASKQVGSGDISNDQKYLVLGDPVVQLNLPHDSVDITSVNKHPATDTVTVRALSLVQVDGVIRDHAGNIQNDFNGTAIITLYDADRNMVISEGDVKQSTTLYGGQLFRGPAMVQNGKFSATFRVPKDIAYDSSLARIHAYAYSDRRDASGMSRRIRVFGLDTTTVVDKTGPDIQVFMDARSFRSGDMVTKQPLLIVDLSDSNGVNASGSGLGHHIEGWLDNSPSSFDLTDAYRTSPTDYRLGSAERRMDSLSAGVHTMRIRAWDIFNNVAEKTVNFLVGDQSGTTLEVSEVVNFPNPLSKFTDFTFRHNQTKPLDVKVSIFSPSGRKVRELSLSNTSDRFVRVMWDGTDMDGTPLANGVYLYRLHVTVSGSTDDKLSFETIEKVAVVR